MAQWAKNKLNANNVNNGNEYAIGNSAVSISDFNGLVSGVLYADDNADTALSIANTLDESITQANQGIALAQQAATNSANSANEALLAAQAAQEAAEQAVEVGGSIVNVAGIKVSPVNFTSDPQTQLNDKEPAFSVLPTSKGGTGRSANYTTNAIITAASTTQLGQVATANGAAYSTSANGALTFGTLPVGQGGTGLTTTTARGVIIGGTSTTGNFQNIGAGTDGQIIKSNGASSNPSWVYSNWVPIKTTLATNITAGSTATSNYYEQAISSVTPAYNFLVVEIVSSRTSITLAVAETLIKQTLWISLSGRVVNSLFYLHYTYHDAASSADHGSTSLIFSGNNLRFFNPVTVVGSGGVTSNSATYIGRIWGVRV